ncbi:unnamed protein product [Diatraea saccharalis]|uniref:Uncharacterized protein n=1 Tax=Diatraea saccharalis TaxID=40085 RepID=A0A9N9QPU6_9NEOP|nr:unnamed protein product [Diatraea saccharalis]
MCMSQSSGVVGRLTGAIWSLIVQLRQHRTILLTTHHLDEAELLSDKLVIMHKGEVHTSGSPLEIKQLLGRGYRLSVLYPGGDRTGLQHSRRLLLHAVRQLQPAATLVPAVGLDVELILPRQHHTQPNL